MRLLVLGHSGQLARELARLAPEARCLGRSALDLAAGDLDATLAAVVDREAPAAVINAAAYTAVDRAESEPSAAFRLNAEVPSSLARICAARDVPLVHVSTDYVFRGDGTRPWRPEDPPAPLSVYGRSKLAGEKGIAAAGGRHAILRTSWVFSAHGTNFVKTMLRLAATRPSIRVVADQVGGPTPAAALARACLAAARALAAGSGAGGIHHFAGAPDVSWADFARAIFATAGREVAVEDIATADWPSPAPRPLNSRLDCTSFERVFGLGRPDWRAGLAEVLTELAVGADQWADGANAGTPRLRGSG